MPSLVILTPFFSPFGKFTFNIFPFSLSKFPSNFWTNFAVYFAASLYSLFVTFDASQERAIDGLPSISPSIAAATVPEYITSVPKLGPLFIPLKTKSISTSFKIDSMPTFTQSAGVPEVE